MRRRVPYDAERSRLLDDLRAAFDEKTFTRAYPGVTPPVSVSIGGDAQEPAFEVIVWPFPQSVTNQHRTTCPEITTSFDLMVGLVASGPTEREASEVLLIYLDCVHQCCMADPSLGGLVEHLHPELSQSGVGTDTDFGYTAGANVRISCRRDIKPSKVIERAIRSVS